MRYSSQRDTVLKVVKAARDHPTADTIYSRVRAELPKLSLGTVARHLSLLRVVGLFATRASTMTATPPLTATSSASDARR